MVKAPVVYGRRTAKDRGRKNEARDRKDQRAFGYSCILKNHAEGVYIIRRKAVYHQGEALYIIKTEFCISSREACISAAWIKTEARHYAVLQALFLKMK